MNIPKDIERVEPLREKYLAAESALEEATQSYRAAEEAMHDAGKERNRLWKIRDEIKKVLDDSKHIANGKCAAKTSATWSRYYTRCPNKAKPDSRFCGVHKREAKNDR